jgi:hypothetical protein
MGPCVEELCQVRELPLLKPRIDERKSHSVKTDYKHLLHGVSSILFVSSVLIFETG